MSRKKYSPLEVPVAVLTESEKLAARVVRRSSEDDPLAVQTYVARASALAKKWSNRPSAAQTKPFEHLGASLRIYEDLREDDRSSKIEVDKTHREKKDQPYIAEVALSASTLIATILIQPIIARLRSETDEISDKNAQAVRRDMEEIRGKLGNATLEDNVIGLMQDVLKFRSINLPPEAEEGQIPDFLSMFLKVPGHSRTGGLMPEAALIRLTRRAALLNDIIENPRHYTPSEIDNYLDSTQKVFVPLAALWRLRAHDENNMDLAATLNAVKDMFQDQILQIQEPEDYKKTYNLILAIVKKVVPERKQEHIHTIRDAKALGLGDVAEQVHGLLPEELQDVCVVQARIKSVPSTYEELKKQGIDIKKIDLQDEKALQGIIEVLRDVVALRGIKRIRTPAHDPGAKTLGIENAELNKLHWTLQQRIIKSGKFTYEPGRKKNLYDPKERKAFFEKKKRQDNGYYAVQDGLLFRTSPIELQLRSERAHGDAELGHSRHDKFKNIPGAALDIANDEVPVYMNNRVQRIKQGGTLADCMVAYFRNAADPALIFSASAKIVRNTHSLDPDTVEAPNKGDATPVIAADHVVIDPKTRPELLYDSEHRSAMIKACKLDSSKNFLMELDRTLSTTDAEFTPTAERPSTTHSRNRNASGKQHTQR